jgi:DNA replication initiation complex subunit (GINS family)
MTDVYENVAKRIEELQKQAEALTAERDLACQTRDHAQAASNKSLFEKRDAEAQHQESLAMFAEENRKMRTALAFARSCIKSGEPWTDTCEDVIGGALK